MEVHFPVLVVLVPMLVAPLVAIFASGTFGWIAALVASAASLCLSVALLNTVNDHGVISYAMGDWLAPWGIEYRIDKLNALVALLVSGVSTVVLPFARSSLQAEISPDREYLLYTCWLLCLAGLLGITVTGDAFNVFVFLEISSLSTYVLVSLASRREAQLAAFRYLIMGTVGATFILIGIGLLYMKTGTLNMADLAELLPGVAHSRPVIAGLGFIVVGIAVKMALFPVHSWLPSAYASAPMAVTAFLGGTATKVAVYLLIRFTLTIFGVAYSYEAIGIGGPLMLLGAAAAVVGSISAMHATDVKRLLAYSSIAQIGYMVIGISLATVMGVAGGLLHVFNHALMKVALFMAVGCVLYQYGAHKLSTFDGLGRKMPVTMAAFTVAALSLIGVPLTAGFISKWYLVVGALQAGWWPIAVLIMITSLMAVIYLGKVLERIWLGEAPDDVVPLRPALPIGMASATVFVAALNIYFGIETSLTVDVALGAASELLGVSG
jgi:multicomponent Na+:H+ antiporter subunit D